MTPSCKPSGDPERSAPADATEECGERTVSSTGKALICVADTGSAHHIRGQKDIPPEQAQCIEEAEIPLTLTTANGTIPVTQKIATKIARLGCTKDMYVLEDSPSVVSIGRLALDDGYDFYWLTKDRVAILVRPDGNKIILDIHNCTPVLIIQESIINRINEFEVEERVIELSSDDEDCSAQDSTPGSLEESAREKNTGMKQKPKKT